MLFFLVVRLFLRFWVEGVFVRSIYFRGVSWIGYCFFLFGVFSLLFVELVRVGMNLRYRFAGRGIFLRRFLFSGFYRLGLVSVFVFLGVGLCRY